MTGQPRTPPQSGEVSQEQVEETAERAKIARWIETVIEHADKHDSIKLWLFATQWRTVLNADIVTLPTADSHTGSDEGDLGETRDSRTSCRLHRHDVIAPLGAPTRGTDMSEPTRRQV